MASNKTGFAYYNIDTDRYQDIRIKRLKKDFSCHGIAVYDYILCEIYRVKGCFLQWDESTAFDVAEYFGIKESLVNEIVVYCAAVGLFNKELLSRESVLTSLSIQKRYIEMCNRAKRSSTDIPKTIIIPEQCTKLPEESIIIPEERHIIQEECDKVKKSRVKKSKVEKSKVKEFCETSSHANLKNYFFEFYLKLNDTPFLNWNGKEAKALNDLIRKMEVLHEQKKLDMSTPAIENSIKTMFSKITDQWILDHISMSLVNSKFSEILVNIKNAKNGQKSANKTTNQSGVSEDYKRDVANRILGNKVPEQV